MNKSTKFWNRRASGFDRKDNPTSDIRKAKYKKIKSYLNKEQLVMDYGCATGSLSQEMADSVKEIHGVDTSDEMVRIATERAKDNNLHNLKFVQGDILDPQFQNAKYDVVLAFYVLHLVPDPDKTLNKLSELLKPGGFLIMETPCLGHKNGLIRGLLKFFIKLAGLPFLNSFKTNDIDQLIENTGLKNVETESELDKIPRYFVVAKNEQ